ncbi:DUF4132 domain-containing protein [Actinomadura rifamycini]|uniref:DUF4132 domain-containing protein n=1 Tax=Actinomadura rifamycini TaxID=31962 RepID=UPI000423AFC0|nr:DUF4132 domain-containing protein [Actinomadura rifamycini]
MIETTGPDENTLVMPDGWARARHPRRDRPGVPAPPAPDRSAAERVRGLVAAVRDDIDHVLGLPDTAPDIADAARAHLGGEANALGAAAVAYVTAPLNHMSQRSDPPPDRLFLDALVAEHGVAFAARAYTEWAGIHADNPACANRTGFPTTYGGRRDALLAMTVRHHGPDDLLYDWWLTRGSARSLRTLLAAAPDDVYAEAVDGIAGARRHPLQKLVAAYLAPTRDDWVEDLWARPGESRFGWAGWLALCALGRPHQPAALGQPLHYHCDREVVATLLDGVGAEPVVPLLVEALDGPYVSTTDAVARTLGFLAALPRDEAFQALVDRIDEPKVAPALMEAARRFPNRAMRLLPGSPSPRAAELLSVHVRANPGIAEDVAPGLPDGERAKVREILDAIARVPAAADLPPLLTEPPWTRPRRKSRPVVIEDLPLPGSRAVAWGPGERDAWAGRGTDLWNLRAQGEDFDDLAAKVAAGEDHYWYEGPLLFLKGPEETARPLLEGWKPRNLWEGNGWLPMLIARHGAAACAPALAAARKDPASFGPYLLPLLSDGIARTMADWLVRLKSAGRTARAWFRRHGTAAAPALVPDALGKAGPARRAAEAALRLIADRTGPEEIVAAARVHGDAAAAAVEALLAADPLDDLPKKIPAVEWADPRTLPQILLRDRTRALPDEAAGHVLTMLAMSKADDPYAGVRVVRDLCDPESLAGFGWALFRRWQESGAPSKEGWALTQLALTGGDDTVRRLTPVIRAWPGDGGHTKAVTGLDVLAAIGTETALMHLNGIAQRVKFKGLKTRAQEKIQEVAAELGLSADQLADRVVPDFGLDASGTLTLDYGPRRFVIGFDELLRPTIADGDGRLRKSLPKPGAADDPELAPAAYKRFAALKKDVRTIATDQLARYERAMVTGRRWSLPDFRDHLAGHPLVGRLVRRLVWLAEDGADGAAGGAVAFRVAEDGTFADAEDDTVPLADTARVRVAHPVHLGGELKAWTDLFADYEILQPFEQLRRPVHALSPEELDGGTLPRFEGAVAPIGALLALTRRGWERGAPMDAGIEHYVSKPLPEGRHLVLGITPGITVGMADDFGDQTLTDVRVAAVAGEYRPGQGGALRLGDLDPVTVSEMLAELIRLTGVTDGTPA